MFYPFIIHNICKALNADKSFTYMFMPVDFGTEWLFTIIHMYAFQSVKPYNIIELINNVFIVCGALYVISGGKNVCCVYTYGYSVFLLDKINYFSQVFELVTDCTPLPGSCFNHRCYFKSRST